MVYNNIGTHYVEDMGEGMMGIYNQNELVHTGQASDFSEGLSGGSGHGDGDILYSGDKAFTKGELFQWGEANSDVAKYIFQSNQPLELQQEFWGYMRAKDMSEAAGPVALAVGFPVAMIAGAELAVGAAVTSEAVGPLANWVRLGKSTHQGNSYFSLRWGAGSRKYLNQIGSKKLQGINKALRKKGGGHWDIFKLK